ncbi:MAG: signal peptidase I [Defluviitaleaceae bacterium]|nr:signal peptidase I [Defluviitaleaceae bacterium]
MKIFRTKNKHVNFWLDVVLITAFFAILCYAFFWPVRVAGNSMSPTINMGDQVAVSRFLGRFGNHSSGDLVMARVHTDDGLEIVIKRVVATSGDHLIIIDDALYINGEQQYWIHLFGNDIFVDIILGTNEYFLLGDNTTISNDSRHFGIVERRHILATIILRYFPISVIEIF